MRWILLLACVLGTIGCSHFEYDLVQPPQFAGRIGTKSDRVVALDSLEYRLIAYDDHLVVRVFNTANEPVELLGQQSYVVTPAGMTYPAPGQTIAPATFLKFILPPMPPDLPPTGPSITFGFGVSSDARDNHSPQIPIDTKIIPDDDPKYLLIVSAPPTSYTWDWPDKTEVRLHLVYKVGEKTFTHDFLFVAKKM